jgi:hypothetical protein
MSRISNIHIVSNMNEGIIYEGNGVNEGQRDPDDNWG